MSLELVLGVQFVIGLTSMGLLYYLYKASSLLLAEMKDDAAKKSAVDKYATYKWANYAFYGLMATSGLTVAATVLGFFSKSGGGFF